MSSLSVLLSDLLELYILTIIAAIVLSYFPAEPGTGMAKAQYIAHRLTEPVLAPVRRVLPKFGSGPVQLDLSPLVVIIVIQVIVRPLVLGL